MYIKILGGIFLMGSTAAIGFIKSQELTARVKRLQEMRRMITFLQGELRFHRATLSEAFEDVAKRIGEPFSEFLKETAKRLEMRQGEGFETIWEEQVQKLLESRGVLKQEVYLWELLKNGLGSLDLTMQTEHFNLAIFRTEDAIREAKEQQENKGKLYRTMGVTVGAMLTLLII